MRFRLVYIIIATILLLAPAIARATVITADTVWQNEVQLTEDLHVPAGITLTIRAGTVVRIFPAESTKTDPEFMSPLTEIIVRGRLKIEGTAAEPVIFQTALDGRFSEWAGIIIDKGSTEISNCAISGADSALYLLNAEIKATGLTITGNRHGVTILGSAGNTAIIRSSISGNDYGIVTLTNRKPLLTGTTVSGNRKKDSWAQQLPLAPETPFPSYKPPEVPLARIYGDEALVGDTVWRGRIRIDGNLRIPDGSRLLITPGTVVEFSRRDSNGDGFGENGILIQGTLIAKGTRQQPILFRSAEKIRKTGDWDSVNLMNSDKAESLVENCIFEDAYRGLHFHYSAVKVASSRFGNNLRAIQFQESAVEILDSDFLGNGSGIQGRDSRIIFSGNRLYGNHQGVNFFRNNVTFTGNSLAGNLKEAVRIREGNARVERNILNGNRQGMLLTDLYYGIVSGNLIANSSENGLAMRNVDNIEISANYLGGNGANGLNLQDARAEISGNLFVYNGERGIGIISFAGNITGNSFSGNGLYAIDLEAAEDIDANDNWWGGATPSSVVCDRQQESRRGRVLADRTVVMPPPFVWPVAEFPGQLTLAGDIIINGRSAVPQGASLTVSPGTTVRFANNAGLTIYGRLVSAGTPDSPVRFTAATGQKPGSWDEIILEQALDSSVSHTIIEYATWGLHGHFTNLIVDHLLARQNLGGIRFRSGPVVIRNSVFRENGIGIRSYLGNCVIEDNVITANETGLFVRERGGGLIVRRNNFSANSDYNIRSGDFNTEDIPAAGNWWGTPDPLTTIFDGRSEEGIGKVIFEPHLTSPLNLEQAGVR